VGLAASAVLAPGCSEPLDTTRATPVRGSVGEEMYGVICDRVGAQALREDMTGESFRGVCHRAPGAQFADKVDTSKLPAITPQAYNQAGVLVSVEDQTRNRNKAVGRIEALGRRRDELIRALDQTFPEDKVAIKDLDNKDETKSCNAPSGVAEGTLAGAVADMLGRMTDLYNDGTIPQSTESLARLVDTFQKSAEAQTAWSKLSSRLGYRPIETALGVARPVVAYPALRDLSNTTLRLVSADSQPYQLDPKYDKNGHRIPVPGAANADFNKILEAAHAELLNATADPLPPALVTAKDPVSGRVVLSRARDNLEIMQELFYTTDDAFGGGAPRYIVRRDPRGYAALSKTLPLTFVDADKDGLPDVDDSGRYKTAAGQFAPSPFPYSGTVDTTVRDPAGRALMSDKLVYDYIDTSKTLASHLLDDLKPLFNPDPAANHETLMDLAGGLYVALGDHVPNATKSYANNTTVTYEGISPDAPILDLLYASGIVLGDKNGDATLAMAGELLDKHLPDLTRLAGDLLNAQEIAKRHDEAKIPKTTTFWDDALEITGQLAADPGLLKDVLLAVADPATANLGNVLAKDVSLKDDMTYNKNDINGPTWNNDTNAVGEMATFVNRKAGLTGKNRSALERVLMLLSDSKGVTLCNKANALLYSKKTMMGRELDIVLPTVEISNLPVIGKIGPLHKGASYAECGVMKMDDLAVFYIDAMADASHVRVDDPSDKIPPGTIYLRNSQLRKGDLLSELPDDPNPLVAPFITALRSLGKPTVGLMAQSSRITGFWNPDDSTTLAPKPEWLDRFAHFDFVGDTINAQSKKMIDGLMGDSLPTAICEATPDRRIEDPEGDEVDAPEPDADGKRWIQLRTCQPGQTFQERNPNTLFLLEQWGFFDTIRPLLQAFVKHKREDLFLNLALAAYKYYPNAQASEAECTLPNKGKCARSGINSYEPLLTEQLVTDVVPALNEIVKVLKDLNFKTCDQFDPRGTCTTERTINGLDVIVDATKTLVNPAYSKDTLKLKDRHGNAGTKKNDGTPIAQVTPAYLLTNALNAVDDAFDKYEAAHPDDKARRANYRRARSQLIDQFLAVNGEKKLSTFANPLLPKMGPKLIEVLRSQLNTHCPKSFAAPFEKCTWASDELTKKAADTLSGPLVSTGLKLMETLRQDADGRRETERLVQYLLDPGSNNDARASVLASFSDILQIMRDDENLVPLYHLLASAVDASVKDGDGVVVEKSLIDAQMSLLAKLSGRYFDKNNAEICRREVDPNQVLTQALAHLVTPINDGNFKGQSPLEVVIDVIADVNRIDPTQPYDGTLSKTDYGSVSENVVDFLMNKERGLEQFYEVIRQGTKF
jgi:hypothetical protein